MKKNRGRILGMLIICSCCVKAQYISFKKVSYTEGLTTYNIRKTFNDKYNFLWTATQDGIYRYDGNKMDVLKTREIKTQAICNNFITDMVYDQNNTIYAASFEGGIDAIDINSLTVTHVLCTEKKNLNQLPGKWITKIVTDGYGSLWILGQNFLAVLHLQSGKLKLFDTLFSAADYSLIGDMQLYNKQYIVLSHKNKGLVILQAQTQQLHTTLSNAQLSVGTEGIAAFTSQNEKLAIAGSTSIHIGTLQKKQWVSPAETGLQQWPNALITQLAIQEQQLWIGTSNNLYLYNWQFQTIREVPLQQTSEKTAQSINHLYLDNRKNIWVSTTKELMYATTSQNGIKSFKGGNGFTIPHLYSLIGAPDNSIYATGTDGLYKTTLHNLQIEKIKGSEKLGLVHCMEQLNDATWLVSSESGMYLYFTATQEFSKTALVQQYPEWKPFLNNAFNAAYTNGIISYWGSFEEEGLIIWNKQTHTLTHLKAGSKHTGGLQENLIHNLKTDRDGYLWILCNNSVCRFDMQKQAVVECYSKAQNNAPPAAMFFDVYDDGNRLWFGSYGGGLNILHKQNKTWSSFTEQNGLCNNAIYGILPQQQDYIWVSSNNGLSRIHLKTMECTNFFEEDGLQSNAFDEKGSLLYQNKLYFAGLDGFSEIDYTRLHTQIQKPLFFIRHVSWQTSDSVFNSQQLNLNRLVLPSNTLAATVTLSLPDFNNQNKYKIFYRINNKEGQYIKTNTGNTIALNGLQYGTYQISFMYTDANNKAIVPPLSLTIIILPKWYQTLLFKIAVVLAIGGIFYMLYRFRVKQITRVLMVRKKISSDLHDDIGSTLSSINMYSQIAQLKPGDQGYLQQISTNTQEVLEKLDDIVWANNPKNDQVKNLAERIDGFGRQLLQAKNIDFHFNYAASINELTIHDATRQTLYLIAKEAINNTAKYAAAANCTVDLFVEAKNICCRIVDDGKGFDNSQPTSRNGLVNMRQRAEALKGTFELKSAIGEGTTVLVKLPIK
jgi:signal transduction histidine kinase/ligand-binding sensor domain-containing protein